METHAQHLHKAPGKKWTHYLFEFLMLFLAVFCGFLAENQREKMVENRREKEYIVSMVEDLKNDSVFLALSINKLIPYHLGWLDSTVHLFQAPDLKGKDRLIYQAFMIGTAWAYNFYPTERTISQLHTEGFHLIRNRNTTNIISQLEAQYKIFNVQIRTFAESMQNDIDLSASSFADRVITDQINGIAFQNFSDSASVELRLSDIPGSATINVENKESIKSYIEKLKKYSFYLQYVIKGGQVALLREISKAMDILKKEYNL
ncbi:MAG: hypothetical protein ACHQF0_11845 [Chitinophagales bacterium]